MKRIIYILTTVLTVFTLKANAQQIDASKITAIQSLLEKYEKYNQFTTDGNSTSAEYTKEFIQLFEAYPEKAIYNDLAAGNNDPSDFRTANAYVDLAIKNFPYGIDIDLDVDRIKVVENFIKDGKNVYIVEVNKKITGLYLIKSFYRYNGKIYFYITESIDKPGNMLISGSFDPTGYRKYAGSKGIKGLYVGLNFSAGNGIVDNIAIVKNSDIYSDIEQDIGPNFGLELYYMFNRNIGLGTGVGFTSFTAKYSINNYNNSEISNHLVTDMDGDQYYPIYQINNLTESNTYNLIDIPLLIKFRTGKGRTGVYFDLGMIYSLVSSTYSIEVNGTNYGQYPDYGNVIIVEPEYGFGTTNSTIEGDLPAPTNALSVYFGTGMSFPIKQSGLFVEAGLNARVGISDMAPTESYNNYDFYHVTGKYGPVGLLEYNLQLGLSYNLSRLKK